MARKKTQNGIQAIKPQTKRLTPGKCAVTCKIPMMRALQECDEDGEITIVVQAPSIRGHLNVDVFVPPGSSVRETRPTMHPDF